ncbi:hypothetical protein CYY_010004 [Polysphondylium violaceum]|uniref:Uncharacterized protein n=2 Tax=Polysphondylium violaceum TaxID=133409 RepID=A0A8J4V034_9MYCE|nr:hypothetical protein CYY_010004 [Polysphondylium violaceum]
MKGDISEIILALIPKTQITKYKFKNDQIQTIINYTKQLIHPNMNYFHIESIISTLSYLSHDQIQILINYSKQFIKKEMNGHEISSIISTLSKQITEYKLNNDQIQAIINYTKEMNGYEISSIISTLSKQITEYKLNNGQIQAIINYTKQLINQKMNGYHISKIILTLSEGLHNDQIQNIINYTKQLIDEKTNDPSNFKECFKNNIILKTCSHLGFRYSFSKILHLYSNNPLAFEQSYICILSLYQRVKSNQFLNFLDIVIACNSEERNYILAKFISEYQDEINAQTINLTQDKIISLKEKDNCCLKNRHNSLDENDTHKYDTTLSDTDEYNTDDTNENDTDENYTDDTDEYNTDKYDTDKYYSNGYYTYETDTDEYDTDEYDTDDTDETDTDEYDTDEYDTDENDTDTQALFMKLNDVKEHIQDYDFKILCRQLSFHPNLFKESIIKSFIKIKNSLGPDVEQHDFQYLIFQSLYPYDDDQLELVCDIIEKTREHKQEYFCCNLHIANNIQRLYYYNYKFTIGNNNFLQVFYSQLKDIDNKSNLECMKTVLLNTLNPKIRFNANI